MSEKEQQSSKKPAENLFAVWSAYSAELNGIGAELSQGIEKAHGDYLRTSQQVLNDADAQTKLRDAWKAHAAALEGLPEGLSIEQRCQKAYERYLHALKEFFAEADVADLNPALLSWVASTMLWAAFWRSSCFGRWCVEASWGWNPNYLLLSRFGPVPNPEAAKSA